MILPTIRTATLGCKVNQYETELVREALLSNGYVDAEKDRSADLCVVNTCTVTAEGDSKSRQAIRRMARDNPAARIVVMGCYATRAPEEILQLPNVVEVVTDKRELADTFGRFGVVDFPTGVSGLAQRRRAYVKVQDGCLLRCSFCIIPMVRPNMYSRPMGEILDEVRKLIDGNYREIVLTGIHLGHYGVDFNRHRPKHEWTRLSHLVDQIARLPGDFRVRLSSIEATEVTRELIDVMATHPQRICPHLHVSMQSGSDTVLRRMRRRWGSRRFIDRCRLLQTSLDRPALTTDIIVGFPGETDEEFEETCEVVREVGFSKIHIFPFSARRGTPAAEMSDPVPPPVKKQRGRDLSELASEMRDRYFHTLLNRSLRVLIERSEDAVGADPATVSGTSCRYAPVSLPGVASHVGQFVTVTPKVVADGFLKAVASF